MMTFQDAKQKAKYGHKDWISYRSRQGESCYEPASAASIKRAMLATGTQKSFTLISANDCVLLKMSWWIANNVRTQFIAGYR